MFRPEGERFEIGATEICARIKVANGGGPPGEGEVMVLRDAVRESFIVAYCREGSITTAYNCVEFSFSNRKTAAGIAEEYARALTIAVQRAKMR